MAFRQIKDLPSDDVGLCYELDRAKKEGLYEEVVGYCFAHGAYGDPMLAHVIELPWSPGDLEAVQQLFPDMTANMLPGQVGELHLLIKFRYGYGVGIDGDRDHS